MNIILVNAKAISFLEKILLALQKLNRIQISGVNIDAVTLNEAVFALNNKRQIIFTPNPEIILKARMDRNYLHILNKANLMLPDGHGLLLVSTLLSLKSKTLRALLYLPYLLLFLVYKKFFKKIIPQVIHGSDFINELISFAADSDYSIFFLGARADFAFKTAKHFKKKFPSLQVAGFSSRDPSYETFELVKKSGANILLVAYGAPKQEEFIIKYFDKLPDLKIAMSVGGSFDFFGGKVKRAPKIFRTIGIEWLWRLTKEPRIRFKRVWNALIFFPIKTIFSDD